MSLGPSEQDIDAMVASLKLFLRRFFPKGTDFTKVSQRQIQEAVDWMNNYPRKVLGWLTPAEAGRL